MNLHSVLISSHNWAHDRVDDVRGSTRVLLDEVLILLFKESLGDPAALST